MKKIVASAAVAALSAASLHAVYAPELSQLERGKPWTVSASLRGFYDDNWAGAPDGPNRQDSFGIEIRPYLGFNFLPAETTSIGISYLGSYSYYEGRNTDTHQEEPWDFMHNVSLKFNHAFSPRYKLSVNDSFIYGQEPDITDTTGITTLTRRSNGSYLHNAGQVAFTGQITERFGSSVTYYNDYWDYDEAGAGSYSARLDRISQTIPLDLRWQIQPTLVGLLGYSFNVVNYTGNSYLYPYPDYLTNPDRSSSRDSFSHTMFLGGDYDITGQLHISARLGATYSAYPNVATGNQWTPYADISASFNYTVGSYATLGFRHSMAPTDMVAPDGTGQPTLDQEASVIYLNINHQITPKLTGNLLAQYQWSEFHSGGANSIEEAYFLLGIYFSYKLSPFVSLEAGYNFDLVNSHYIDPVTGSDDRGYDRNRVYLGVRGTY